MYEIKSISEYELALTDKFKFKIFKFSNIWPVTSILQIFSKFSIGNNQISCSQNQLRRISRNLIIFSSLNLKPEM